MGNPERPKVFVSAVSAEFRTLRDLLAKTVKAMGFDPVWQDAFDTDPSDIRDMLRAKIRGCRLLIQLVGDGYGAEPPLGSADPEGFGRVSYTQFEYLYAKETLGIQVLPIFPLEGCTRDKGKDELDLPGDREKALGLPDAGDPRRYQAKRRKLQNDYAKRISASEQLWIPARNDDHAKLCILELKGDLEAIIREEIDADRKFRAALEAMMEGLAKEVTAVRADIAAVQASIDALAEQSRNQHEEVMARLKGTSRISGGTIRAAAEHFVGREDEIAKLHAALENGRSGIIAAVHGLGGQGKTELAYRYAEVHAASYPGGIWLLGAEGRSSLTDVIWSNLVPFGLTPTEDDAKDRAAYAVRVIDMLEERSAGRGRILLIFDNVSDKALLASRELDALAAKPWLRLLLTTRMERDVLPGSRFVQVPVDSLPEPEAVRLIESLQPSGRFASDEDRAAATEIVRDLGGYTIAVEQVAAYLGFNRRVRVAAYLKDLRARGLVARDEVIDRDARAKAQIKRSEEQAEKQLSVILESTLRLLDDLPAARATLDYACHLPPDSIHEPWLRDLAAEDADWHGVLDRLAQLRLLQPGELETSLRMHRLVAAHLRARASADRRQRLGALVRKRALAMFHTRITPDLVELDALAASIPPLIKDSADLHDLAADGVFVGDKLSAYRPGPMAHALVDALHSRLLRDAESDPANARWQRDLSASWDRIGDLRLRLGDGDGAREAFEEGLKIAQELARREPNNEWWQRDLSVSWNKIGDLRFRLGDGDGARQAFEEDLKIAQDLARRDPANVEWQRDLSVSWDRIGNLRLRLDDGDGAREAFEASLAIRQDLARRDPANAQWQRDLSVSWNRIGKLRLRLGDGDGAQTAFEEYHKTTQDLARRDPANAGWQHDLSLSWSKIGDLRLRLGDGDGAQKAFEASLAILQDLARRDPANAQWQRDLSVNWERIGNQCLRLGDGDGAREAFEASHKIAQDLARRDPSNAEWQRDLFVSFVKMGNLAGQAGDADSQRDWYRKAHDQLAGMKARGIQLSAEDEGHFKVLKEYLGL